MTQQTMDKLLAHMDWADGRVSQLLSGLPDESANQSLRLFSHVLAAERVWLLRLQGMDSRTQAIWPELTRAELVALAAANRTDYSRYCRTLSSDLRSEISYTTQSGAAHRTAVEDILIHVAMHGSYHRGQIAAAVRASGGEPENTDYITYARQNLGGAR